MLVRSTSKRSAKLPLLLLSFVVACSSGDRRESQATAEANASTQRASKLPDPIGPLAGMTWPAGSVPTRVLLHDDGRRLWAIKLSGARKVIWKHPQAKVVDIGVAPDGKELALSVALLPNNAKSPSFVLYLLRSDGSITTVDVVRNFKSIDYPIFLRAPTQLKGPIRLYWVRTGEQVDFDTGRLNTQVMVLTGRGPQPVRIPLRFSEAPLGIFGYPGMPTLTLSLFGQGDVPTRLQIIKNVDYTQSTKRSLTLWGSHEFRAATDVFVGVAWLSPTDYVIPVAQRFHKKDYSLRLFRAGCELFGSRVIYSGPRIDWGFAETPWNILPAGKDRVLVLGSEAMRKVARGRAKRAPWLAVDVESGAITKTGAAWERGAWTWVSPDDYVNPRKSAKCTGIKWTWP